MLSVAKLVHHNAVNNLRRKKNKKTVEVEVSL